jgi:hypothetical protein
MILADYMVMYKSKGDLCSENRRIVRAGFRPVGAGAAPSPQRATEGALSKIGRAHV